jgi:hypothetical protein
MKTAQRSDPPGSSREGLPLLGERAGGVGFPGVAELLHRFDLNASPGWGIAWVSNRCVFVCSRVS